MAKSQRFDESHSASWMARLSNWAGLGHDAFHGHSTVPLAPRLVGYRLRQWPELRGGARTVGALRALSFMSHHPVTAAWFARHAEWPVARAEAFLESLVDAGYAERVGG